MSGIILTDLSKKFGGTVVFDRVSAVIPSGAVCLGGRSGCGKTTLARLISGLEKPDGGKISGVSGNVTYMFQEPRLFPAFSALENVICVGGQKADKNRALELLLSLGISEEDMKKLPHQLSGGMNQRVSLARAVLFFEGFGGNTVILDEPFKGLDPDTRGIAAELVKKSFSCENLIVITHDSSDAELLSGVSVDFETLFL